MFSDIENVLKNKSVFVFDLDGVVFLGEEPILSSVKFIQAARSSKRRVFFLTNNSSSDEPQLRGKLEKMGLDVDEGSIFSPLIVLPDFLKNKFPHSDKVYIVGNDQIKNRLNLNGFNVVPHWDAELLAIAMCSNFGIDILNISANLLRNGVPTVACNRDPCFPVAEKVFNAGCGALVKAIEVAAEREVWHTVGKPEAYIIDILCRNLDCPKDQVLVFGDRFESDILMAKNAGIEGVLLSDSQSHDGEVLRVGSLAQILHLL